MENGIILYSIELDGCLNGVYTNEEARGEIFNEIAKASKFPFNEDDLSGDYNCFYFEKNRRNNATLQIKRRGQHNIYDFIWEIGGEPAFKGLGTK